jgi:hypothetical protein
MNPAHDHNAPRRGASSMVVGAQDAVPASPLAPMRLPRVNSGAPKKSGTVTSAAGKSHRINAASRARLTVPRFFQPKRVICGSTCPPSFFAQKNFAEQTQLPLCLQYGLRQTNPFKPNFWLCCAAPARGARFPACRVALRADVRRISIEAYRINTTARATGVGENPARVDKEVDPHQLYCCSLLPRRRKVTGRRNRRERVRATAHGDGRLATTQPLAVLVLVVEVVVER